MKNKYLNLALIGLCLAACKKEGSLSSAQKKLAEVGHFVPGKGFDYLASYSENNGDMISLMNSIDISVTADNRLHWLFSRSNPFSSNEFLYRKVLDAKSGDPIADGDLKSVGNVIVFNAYDRGLTDKFGFVPYSDKVYRAYRSGDAKFKVEGEITAAEYGGYDGTGIKAVFYANSVPTLHFAWNIKANLQDINTRIGAYEVKNGRPEPLADVNKTFWSYGKSHNFDKLYHGGMSFPTIDGGSSAFGFTESKAYLFKKIGKETIAVDSIAYKGIPFYSGSVVPNVPFVAKTSKDMKTTVLACYEPDSYTAFSGKYKYSVFVIDNETNKIKIAVNQFAMVKTQMDVDLKGNLYYPVQPTDKSAAKVMKVSGESQSVFAEGFFDQHLQIRNLQVVNDKVYITSLTSEDKTVSRISLFVAN
ncbi:MAG: hypothetical protein EOP54_05630 [Sphingobacteriales bacterium]|nr:MAG: hypothetical protein EOP54_05630 [Sphingobacteriales bacterium]